MRINIIHVSQERLKHILSYDHLTGVFTWNVLPKKKVYLTGMVAGNVNRHGYHVISIDGIQYAAHRLAYLYMTGNQPESLVDHIDGNKINNAWSNLRDATPSQNIQNLKIAISTNKTGYLGVSKRGNRYLAQIKIDGKKIALGSFGTPELAHDKYLAEKRKIHSHCTL
jgi:hypothetical protein